MSHKVSLSSLVLDFKRKTSGEGAAANNKLCVLVAYALAYVAPLPNNGVTGSLQAYRITMQRHVNAVISDVNELMHVDLRALEATASALYENRYAQVYSDEIALNTLSVSEIIKEAFGESVLDTLRLWAPQFIQTIRLYVQENRLIEDRNANQE